MRRVVGRAPDWPGMSESCPDGAPHCWDRAETHCVCCGAAFPWDELEESDLSEPPRQPA